MGHILVGKIIITCMYTAYTVCLIIVYHVICSETEFITKRN